MSSIRIPSAGIFLLLLLSCIAIAADTPSGAPQSAVGGVDWFESKVRPIFAEHCYECHSGTAKPLQGGLQLDTLSGIRRGGDSGPLLVPGQPTESLLIEAVRCEGFELEMPPAGKLAESLISRLEMWVEMGAPLPDAEVELVESAPVPPTAQRDFWSFQPLRSVVTPDAATRPWVRRRMDAFVWEGLQRAGLHPAPAADRRVLLRRLYFDLIGLPPTAHEIEAFLADEAEDAWERRVDQLLASPLYGQRWARHWMDLMRYADQTATFLSKLDQAWRYRDWLVGALNDDMPYDRFVRLQLAADHCPDAAIEELAALGFLGLSPVYFKELMLSPEIIQGIVADEWEERVDAISRTFLGLTLACARCHDHKYDPVTTEDYYALAGVLASTRIIDRPVLPPAEAAVVQAAKHRIEECEQQIAMEKKRQKSSAEGSPAGDPTKVAALEAEVETLRNHTPHFNAPVVHAVDDAAVHVVSDAQFATRLDYHPNESLDLHVHIRGNPARTGQLVPRRFLGIFGSDEAVLPWRGSGRRELADAIVTSGAPLAARVMVNRIWYHHFGVGLVETPSDFGVQGARPSHPELLEDLTARFVEAGWSMKWLHREILLSATWQQTSRGVDQSLAVDPNNRWLGRMNRRRLEFEAWRDAMLAVSERLDTRLNGPPIDLNQSDNRRRTLYGTIDRYDLYDAFRLYDLPDPGIHSPARLLTTTPLQQLFVLNGPLLMREAQAVVDLIGANTDTPTETGIKQLYHQVFARDPTDRELQWGKEFLESPDAAARPWHVYVQSLLASNEFLFVD